MFILYSGMSKLEADYTVKLWNTKHISEPDEYWFISKIFKTKKQTLPIEQQRKIIEMKKEYFWEYMPETQLVETENWEYIIRQKFIEWRALAWVDVSSLSAETLSKLLDLIKKYLQYHKEQWWEMDITWYQYYPSNPNSIKRKIINFLKISQNFLASTNIMIWDDWNPYMVDVCESADSRLQWKIKNLFAKPFIKRTISGLEKTLQKRIDFENENISREILNVLHD